MTETLEAIVEHCNKDTLVVFDVDGTLVVDDSYPIRLVDEKAPEIIRQLVDKGVKIMALTGREIGRHASTVKQLEQAGITFDVHSPWKMPMVMRKKDIAYYKQGVMCCGTSNKGAVLKNFLNRLDRIPCNTYHPQQIVFVDDIEENVRGVTAAFADSPRVVTAFYYAWWQQLFKKRRRLDAAHFEQAFLA